MLIPHLPDTSRVWLFASSTLLTPEQVSEVSLLLKSFVEQWKSHGNELTAGFDIVHESIVIVAVDESQEVPSGCSIDKVFRLLQQTEIDFFQRTLLWIPFCNSVKIISPELALEQYTNGDLTDSSLVINSLIQTLGEARNNMYVPLSESWMAQRITRYKHYER